MPLRLVSISIALLVLLAGCKSTGTAFNPPGGIGGARAAHIVVGSTCNTSGVATFAGTATGNVAPTTNIAGGSTQLSVPDYLFATSSTLYVTDESTDEILEWPSSATGNTAPTVTIAGANTTIESPSGIEVTSGSIYVADFDAPAIDIFPASASGNVAPTARITGANTHLQEPNGLWLDASGNIWVADQGTNALM